MRIPNAKGEHGIRVKTAAVGISKTEISKVSSEFNVKLYEDSFTEWVGDPGNPTVTWPNPRCSETIRK